MSGNVETRSDAVFIHSRFAMVPDVTGIAIIRTFLL